MLTFIVIVVFFVFLLGMLVYLTSKIVSKKGPQKLPSGRAIPSRERLAKMKAGQLKKEYSKEDLRWLRGYVMKQLPKTPLGAENVAGHMKWLDISHELDTALYGWC